MREIDFADWLVKRREGRKMTQADLARASGLSTAHVSRLENRRSAPGPESLSAIAKGLRVPEGEAYRAAGLLPPMSSDDAVREQINHDLDSMSESRRRQAQEFIHFLASQPDEPESAAP